MGRPIVPSVPSYGPWGARLAIGARRAARAADVVVGVSLPYTTVPAADRFSRRTTTTFVALPILHLGEWAPSDALVRSMRRADRCVALTTSESEWLAAHGLSGPRLTVIPPGCDATTTPLDRHDARGRLGLVDRPTVVFVGRLAAHKGIDTLLAAAPGLLREHPDLTILVAGDRTGWTGFDDVLRSVPATVAERIVVRDNFDDADRDLLFGAADVVVVPSREEAFGMVILEAWAAQRPVVASDLVAIGSVVRAGVDGELVPVGDAPALTAAISSLLADPRRATAMGEAGRRRVDQEFSWEAVVDRWHHELVAAATVSAPTPPVPAPKAGA